MYEAGDERVLVNGRPLPVRFRVISEDNYATLYNYALLWLNYTENATLTAPEKAQTE